jgi:protein OPY2
MARPETKSTTNVGAIAGGVIGGIAVVAILTFIVWKYCLKGKRRPISEVDWQRRKLRPTTAKGRGGRRG